MCGGGHWVGAWFPFCAAACEETRSVSAAAERIRFMTASRWDCEAGRRLKPRPAASVPGPSTLSILNRQLPQILDRLVHRADLSAGHAAAVVEVAQQHQVLEVGRGFEASALPV